MTGWDIVLPTTDLVVCGNDVWKFHPVRYLSVHQMYGKHMPRDRRR